MKKQTVRELMIVRRYLIKQDYAPKGLHKGDIVLIVRNDQGKEYEVVLRRNGSHSCNCPAGAHSRRCYHVSTMVKVENARIEARKAVKVVVMPTPVEAPKVPDIMDAPLTTNRGFSILKIA